MHYHLSFLGRMKFTVTEFAFQKSCIQEKWQYYFTKQDWCCGSSACPLTQQPQGQRKQGPKSNIMDCIIPMQHRTGRVTVPWLRTSWSSWRISSVLFVFAHYILNSLKLVQEKTKQQCIADDPNKICKENNFFWLKWNDSFIVCIYA